jgi:DNA-binding transcriptional ArsR family regulator
MQEDELDHVFAALANPVRRRILDVLKADPGCSVQAVAEHFEISRIAVMKHLDVLVGAGLVVRRRRRQHRFRR